MASKDPSNSCDFQARMYKYFIPTSAPSQRLALDRLLKHFCLTDVTVQEAILSNGTSINYVDIKRTGVVKPENVLILTHGFGLGLGFYFANFDSLVSKFDRVIATDWTGMGGSSRTYPSNILEQPKRGFLPSLFSQLSDSVKKLLPIPSPWKQYNAMHPSNATDYFIDDLESFRKQVLGERNDGSSKFVLAGHSLGGYLSARYALKYPGNVKGLILLSPVGLPPLPAPDVQVPLQHMSRGYLLWTALWSLNFTPQSLLRFAGPKGPDLLNSIIDRRFGRRWVDNERSLIGSYLYHITAAPPAGEYALNSILTPIVYTDGFAPPESLASKLSSSDGNHTDTNLSESNSVNSHSKSKATSSSTSDERRGQDERSRQGGAGAGAERSFRVSVFAREPLHDQLVKLKKHEIPLLIMFGDNDWMRYDRMHEDVIQWRAQGLDVALETVTGAGHHLYLDNAEDMHTKMFSWLKSRKLLSVEGGKVSS